MPTPVIGAGFLIANDILTDISFKLLEPAVNTTLPVAIVAALVPQTVNQWDNSIYTGAQLVVGVIGGDAEVVTVTGIVSGVSFSAIFLNAHLAGEPVVG